jgi:transposase
MKSISSSQHSSVVSLLQKGYSLCQIQDRTGLGKSTVGRISKKVDFNKENHPGGCPSKLSTQDKQAIVCQITTGKLDNAVQATQFINNIITNTVSPQTVRNALKEAGLHSATKKKVPMLKQAHHQKWLKFALYHEIGLKRTGRECCGVMKPRLIELDQMERCMCGKNEGNWYLTA